MSKQLSVRLEQIDAVAFSAVAGHGGKTVVDGKPEIGGAGLGMRPMEMLLASLASCTAMDVLFILRKQKEPVEKLAVDIEGTRADQVPYNFTQIHMRVVANAEVALNKLERAVTLSAEKYCSVGASLSKDIELTHEAALADG